MQRRVPMAQDAQALAPDLHVLVEGRLRVRYRVLVLGADQGMQAVEEIEELGVGLVPAGLELATVEALRLDGAIDGDVRDGPARYDLPALDDVGVVE